MGRSKFLISLGCATGLVIAAYFVYGQVFSDDNDNQKVHQETCDQDTNKGPECGVLELTSPVQKESPKKEPILALDTEISGGVHSEQLYPKTKIPNSETKVATVQMPESKVKVVETKLD